MAKSLIPKSKAKTAYGLLSEIRKLILEEPKRYDQGAWCYTAPSDSPLRPTCGTTACVAGWVYTLKPTDRNDPFEHVGDMAERVLGLREAGISQWELFNDSAAGSSGRTLRERIAHAKRGAKHIAAFQQKYAKQLKAKRV